MKHSPAGQEMRSQMVSAQASRPISVRLSSCAHAAWFPPLLAQRLPPRTRIQFICHASKDQKRSFPGDSGWDPLQVKKDPGVFNKLREIELIHARWAMLGVLSLVVSDMAGSPLYPPRDVGADVLLPLALVGGIALALLETYRLAALWGEQDADARMYPGGRFDVLGVTRRKQQGPPPGLGVYSAWLGGLPGWLGGGWWFQQQDMTAGQLGDMKARELKNGRLAMISFVGCCLASLLTGKGPYTLLCEHLADPLHHTILQSLSSASS